MGSIYLIIGCSRQTMKNVFLALFLLVIQLSQEQPTIDDCCKKKTVGGDSYTLTDMPADFPKECLKKCAYTKDGKEGDMYCFGAGSLEPTCHDTVDQLPFSGGGSSYEGIPGLVCGSGSGGAGSGLGCDFDFETGSDFGSGYEIVGGSHFGVGSGFGVGLGLGLDFRSESEF